MGLCKCPKRKTTSHFCFQHCVNVCEHCIINNHTTCVVKSYTTWLKEASSIPSTSVSVSASCSVCQKQLFIISKETEYSHSTINLNESNSNLKTSIRLLCYHVAHTDCLSTYIKKQLKEGNSLKCPSCTRSLWYQNSDLFNSTEVDYNDLSPVALILFKHFMNHGEWWGQSLIKNEEVEDIEKYLQEDNNISDRETQLFEGQSILEAEQQFSATSNNKSPLAIPHTAVLSSNSNPPIHHRHFINSNYGLDTESQELYSSINMTNLQSSDLSNRYPIPFSTPLLINADDNLKEIKENEDPSGKNKPKKIKNQSWKIWRIGPGKHIFKFIVLLLFAFTVFLTTIVICSYWQPTNNNTEPIDSINSIDYGGNSDTALQL